MNFGDIVVSIQKNTRAEEEMRMIHKEDSNSVVYWMKNWILLAETPPAGNLASFPFLMSQLVALIGVFIKKHARTCIF